jgi:hypothetical protein
VLDEKKNPERIKQLDELVESARAFVSRLGHVAGMGANFEATSRGDLETMITTLRGAAFVLDPRHFGGHREEVSSKVAVQLTAFAENVADRVGAVDVNNPHEPKMEFNKRFIVES